MTIDPPRARGKARYQGDLYFFCSPDCMQKFMASPAKYLPPSPESGAPAPPPPLPKKLDKDPVCGRSVGPSNAVSTAEYDGKLYHFCSRGCAERFRRDPKKYLEPAPKSVGMTGLRSTRQCAAPEWRHAQAGQGPGLRHECRSHHCGQHRHAWRRNLLLLFARLWRKVQSRAG